MQWAWEQWQVMAWIAPVAWAVAALIDVFLIKSQCYRSAVDGTSICSLFGAVPCLGLALATGGVEATDVTTAGLAVFAGVLFVVHVHAYFKALFAFNDAAHVDTAFNAHVIVVPALAFLCLGERLTVNHYAGIGLAAVGVLLLLSLRMPGAAPRLGISAVFVIGVLSLSLSLVVLDAVFQRCGYWTGLFWSSVGWLAGASILWWVSGQRGVFAIARRRAGLFTVNEVIGGVAVIGTQRATDLSPSVSYIPVIECTSPVVILLLSAAALLVLRVAPTRHRALAERALREQLRIAPVKLLATALLVGGMLVIQSGTVLGVVG